MTLIRPLKNPQMLRWLLLTACILLFLSMPALAQTAGGTANPLSGISAYRTKWRLFLRTLRLLDKMEAVSPL